MSLTLGIHFWPLTDNAGELVRTALECAELPYDCPVRLRVRNGTCNPQIDREVCPEDIVEIPEFLRDLDLTRLELRADAVFDLNTADRSRASDGARPLDVVFYGKDNGLKGSARLWHAPMSLVFFNLLHRFPTEGGAISQEYAHILRVVRSLVHRISPIHLIVCTESELHPLTAHSLYHADWRGFLYDLQEIARLHHGGVYLRDDIGADHPAARPPGKQPPHSEYGYLRTTNAPMELRAERLAGVLRLAEAILKNPPAVSRVSREELSALLTTLGHTVVEEMGDSFLLTASGSPWAYLEEPYIRLFEYCAARADAGAAER